MIRGDVTEVTAGECTDLYYVDTGMYDVDEYGAVYEPSDPAREHWETIEKICKENTEVGPPENAL